MGRYLSHSRPNYDICSERVAVNILFILVDVLSVMLRPTRTLKTSYATVLIFLSLIFFYG